MISSHPTPNIQDYEILRKIGGGAYGAVWMARGMTGALRAIKVVRRSDYDDEKSFETEFEGVLKFEPISRDHPGLVNLLHVGRSSEEDDYYYYVMELGDDVTRGDDINPADYDARTLQSDTIMAGGRPQSISHALEVGISLAGALGHLHNKGLSHRDVKPANVIFVNGKAKLADIGLVAVSDRHTFVGTQGFVPPEGPGSAQADLYSLGKVLYELTTGKDRMQFPEVPEQLHPDADSRQWNSLNEIICNLCEPQISRRKIKNAEELANALELIQEGKKANIGAGRRKIQLSLFAILMALIALCVTLMYDVFFIKEVVNVAPDLPEIEALVNGNDTEFLNFLDEDDLEIRKCIVNFIVSPNDDVEVYNVDDEFQGYLDELELSGEYEVGEKIEFYFKKVGYEDLYVELVVPDQDVYHESYILRLDQPPETGKRWTDSLGQVYLPDGTQHRSDWVGFANWERYQEQNFSEEFGSYEVAELKDANNKFRDIVLVTKEDAKAHAEWLTERAQLEGRLKDSQIITPVFFAWKAVPKPLMLFRSDELYPMKLMVKEVPLATLIIDATPKSAMLFVDGVFVGSLTQRSFQLKPGERIISIENENFDSYVQKITLSPGQTLRLEDISLTNVGSLDPTQAWKNTLGMKFVNLADNLLVSVWETKVRHYRIFLNETGGEITKYNKHKPASHPVSGVSLGEAQAFAKWLTKRDRDLNILPQNASYAIPTDEEWSMMANLSEDDNLLIEEKSLLNKSLFPWDGNWTALEDENVLYPDILGAVAFGNLSDETRRDHYGLTRSYYEGYQDGFFDTSPVGSYSPYNVGIYDLVGNVSEWVTDTVADGSLQIFRGSNYKTHVNNFLASSYRGYLPVGSIDERIGFRLVIRIREVAVESTEFYELDEDEDVDIED
ncbi:SUMF1/EgtB/PvdO family nonheme iron enzyme [Akkermansiaceae bacterium]|nr:SUMF1/EgtB/PvdO family nonheme iron enzyme [Akkermansiaceae bacterium]